MSRSQRYRRIITVVVEEGFGTALDQLGVRAPWVTGLLTRRRAAADANLSPEQRVRRTMERLGQPLAMPSSTIASACACVTPSAQSQQK